MIRLTSLLTEGAALTSEFLQRIMNWENSIKAGWNAKKQRWFPHSSIEGGTGTIAYGHKLTADDIASGRFANGITQREAEKLLKDDLYAASKKVEAMIPSYRNLPDSVRQGLINAAYRGELKSTYQTVKLMNANNWRGAAEEYLNHDEYKSGRYPGVKQRMKWNYDQFAAYAKSNTKQSTPTKPQSKTDASTTKTYTVKAGETLGGIANRNKTTVADILKKNPGLKADKIQTGQKIFI
jgi:LysM repeat protein